MVRKSIQDESSLIEIAIESNWKFSAVLATLPLLFTYIVFPLFFSSNLFFKTLIPTFGLLSLLWSTFFGFIAAIKILILVFSNKKDKHIPRNQKEVNQSHRTESTLNIVANPEVRATTVVKTVSNQNKLTSLTHSTESQRHSTPQTALVDKWSLDLLNSLDWKRFEDLCSAYFTEKRIRNLQTPLGADRGIDILIYSQNSDVPSGLAQCKRWSSIVGVVAIREFLGVMHNEKVSKGYFFTTSSFNKTAIEFADDNNVKLIDGKTLLEMIHALPEDSQVRLLSIATAGDYTTPTCVRCGTKLILRESAGKKFWGCKNFPRCRITIQIKVKS